MSRTVWREELRGRSLGVFFVSVFGLVWASMGLTALPDGLYFVLGASSVLLVLALLSVAGYLHHAARFVPEMPQGTMNAATWRRFRIVGVTEGLAIGAAVFVLVRVEHSEWIPAIVALIVGLHFFPLASLFRVRLYHATGLLLCAVFALTVILALTSGVSAGWFAVPGIGCALVLWATGAALAVSGIRNYRVARSK
ncbi:MAG: DUF7010 family protein [Rubrobacter sp.]